MRLPATLLFGDSQLGPYVTATGNLWDTGTPSNGALDIWSSVQHVPRPDSFAALRGTVLQSTVYVVVQATDVSDSRLPKCTVWQNGVYFATVAAPTALANATVAVAGLTIGATIEIWCGEQVAISDATAAPGTASAVSSSIVIGAYGISVIAPSTPSRQLVIVCDSVEQGYRASDPGRTGPAGLIKQSYPGRVTVLGYGKFAMAGYGVTAAQMATAVANRLGNATIQRVLWTAGVNDVGGVGAPTDTLANLATYVDTFATTLHGLKPNATIVVRSQTPSQNEATPNTSGFTNQDLRGQSQTICGNHSGYMTYADGTTTGLGPAWTTNPQFWADNVHTNDLGAIQVAAFDLALPI